LYYDIHLGVFIQDSDPLVSRLMDTGMVFDEDLQKFSAYWSFPKMKSEQVVFQGEYCLLTALRRAIQVAFHKGNVPARIIGDGTIRRFHGAKEHNLWYTINLVFEVDYCPVAETNLIESLLQENLIPYPVNGEVYTRDTVLPPAVHAALYNFTCDFDLPLCIPEPSNIRLIKKEDLQNYGIR